MHVNKIHQFKVTVTANCSTLLESVNGVSTPIHCYPSSPAQLVPIRFQLNPFLSSEQSRIKPKSTVSDIRTQDSLPKTLHLQRVKEKSSVKQITQ